MPDGCQHVEDITALAECPRTARARSPQPLSPTAAARGVGMGTLGRGGAQSRGLPDPSALLPLPQLTLLVVQVSILYYGGHLVISGQMTSGNLISFIIYEFVLGDCMEVRGWLAEGGPGEREERVAERDLSGVLQGLREVGRRSKVGRAEIIMTPLASDSREAARTLFQKMHTGCHEGPWCSHSRFSEVGTEAGRCEATCPPRSWGPGRV